MMNEEKMNVNIGYIRKHISSLCVEKGISEYQLGLDMGRSRGYIQNITSGRALPSMTEFFTICEHLGVTPGQFFNELDMSDPTLTGQILEIISKYDDKALRTVLGILYILESR